MWKREDVGGRVLSQDGNRIWNLHIVIEWYPHAELEHDGGADLSQDSKGKWYAHIAAECSVGKA